jgi:hypothetical protein
MSKRKGKLKPIKRIDIKKIRFAPEIEVEFPKGVDGDKIIAHEKIRGWTVKYDGSLENGAEFVPNDDNHLYFNREGLRQIQDVLKRIKRHKGKISGRCGLHIHVDVKTIDDDKLCLIVKEFIHKQRYVIDTFKVSKDRLDSSCALIPRKYLNKLNAKKLKDFRTGDRGWGLMDEYFDRNSALNILCLPDTGSIEFRLFNGSIDYQKMVGIIHWVLLFMKECQERD